MAKEDRKESIKKKLKKKDDDRKIKKSDRQAKEHEKDTSSKKKGMKEKVEAMKKAKAAKGKGEAKKKKAKPTWQAPEDFKPHFLEVVFKTDKDGLISTDIKATRYQGRYDPNAEDKKKADLGSYDMRTLLGIAVRLASVTYKATNDKKYPSEVKGRLGVKGAMRLPANTTFKMLMRVNRKSKDNTLSVNIKTVWQAVKLEGGRVKAKELDKKDPVCRLIRRAKNFLPAAFKGVQMPPKRTRGGRKVEKDEDDE